MFGHPANEHARPVDGRRFVDGSLEVMVRARERGPVAVPQMSGQPEQLFETTEPLRGGLERQAHHRRFVLAIADPQTQPRPAARQHVQGGDGLDEQRRWSDRRRRDHRPQLDALRRRGHVGKGRVGLEHRFVDRGGRVHLQQVVGDPERVEAGPVDLLGEVGDLTGQRGRLAGPRVVGEGDAELHDIGVSANTG